MSMGVRVLRGPDWDQNEADGGEGHLGTVVGVKVEEGTAEVVWDKGQATRCRVGKEGKHDLRVLDNAQAGIKHPRQDCNGCQKTIFGMRWRCVVCENFDLCLLCYVMDVHDLSHEFERILRNGVEGIPVGSRLNSSKVRLVGIFPGARVARGPDWLAANADGGAGGQGTVVEVLSPESGSARNAVRVSWDSGQSLQHRLGLHGKVDLLLVKESPASAHAYLEHLPVLELERKVRGSDNVDICVGEKVKLDIEEEALKAAQKDRSGWTIGMRKCIGQTGVVKAITTGGDVEVDFGEQKWRLNPIALKKGGVVTFSVGDKVRLLEDLEKVKELQEGHGKWVDGMRPFLGKVGRVKRVDSDGDLKVAFGQQEWKLNPLCCELDPDAELESSTDELTGLLGGLRMQLGQLAGLTGLAGATGLQGLLGTGLLGTGLGGKLKMRLEDDANLSPSAKKFAKALVIGDASKVTDHLDKEPELLQQKIRGASPLHLAADAGEAEVAALLLDRGADINQGDMDEDTPLIVAVGKHRKNVIQLLIERGADVNCSNENGRTALHKASNRGRVDICRLLMQQGASVNKKDVNGNTPLFGVMETSDEADTMEVLLQATDVDFSQKNRKTFNLLQFAAYRGRPMCMAKLLARDKTLVNEHTDDERWTSLHIAAVNDHAEDLRLLIQAGGDVNCRNINALTPLHLASREAYIDSTMVLAENGAELNAQDDDGFTPLHRALNSKSSSDRDEESRLQLANYLIQQGARTDIRNNKSDTALNLATQSLRAKVEEFIRDNDLPPAKSAAIYDKYTTPPSPLSDPQKPAVGSREAGSTKSNERPSQQILQTVVTARKCSKCFTKDVGAIFLPCAHKLLCQGCAASASVCPQCGKQVMRLIDLQGNII